MYRAKKRGGALGKWRPGCIEKFIANHDHAPGFYSGNVLPRGISERARWLRAVTSRRPRQNDHIRTSARDLFIRDTGTRRHHSLSTRHLDQFRNPRRRTNAGMRPCLAVNARARSHAKLSRLPRERLKIRSHLVYQLLASVCAIRQTSERANVRLDISQRARINRKKSYRLSQDA